MPWNVGTIFKDSVITKNIIALTPYVVVEGDYIIDPKFNDKFSLKKKKVIKRKKASQLIIYKRMMIMIPSWIQDELWVNF